MAVMRLVKPSPCSPLTPPAGRVEEVHAAAVIAEIPNIMLTNKDRQLGRGEGVGVECRLRTCPRDGCGRGVPVGRGRA